MEDFKEKGPRKLEDQAGREILMILMDAGGTARFVGGCVRDHLIRRPFYDVDIATSLLPEKVMELATSNNVKAIPTGLKHGTVTLVHQGETFEVTTLRKDVSTDGRHADVEFSDNWIEDAKRRDFTMNTLSLDLYGTLYDPFDGEKDLRTGLVRFVGKAEDRIKEDYLRLLRFFRFLAHYSKQNPNTDDLEVCQKMASGLDKLSGERIRDELLKILCAPHPTKWLRLMQRYDVLDHILPELGSYESLEMLSAFEDRPDALRRLTLITHPEKIDAVTRGLKLSNHDKKMMQSIRVGLKDITTLQSLDQTRAHLFDFGPDHVAHAFYIFCAEKNFQMLNPKQDPHFQEIEKWRTSPIEFPIKGRDLKVIGVDEGIEMGRILKEVQNWWKGKGCHPDFEACLDYARSIK